uniref:Uncharacterized protein n=1 Tax=Arundo donax TaxID=35708 RepID=A0A0A8Z1T2_ARUDO
MVSPLPAATPLMPSPSTLMRRMLMGVSRSSMAMAPP